jgi:hypothetical protein
MGKRLGTYPCLSLCKVTTSPYLTMKRKLLHNSKFLMSMSHYWISLSNINVTLPKQNHSIYRRVFGPFWQLYPFASAEFPAFNGDWLSSEDSSSLVHCYNTSTAVLGEPFIVTDP